MGNCLGVCVQNYLDSDVIANSFVSSEKGVYPEGNAYDLNRRTRVWRSDGHWSVASGSNTIVFRETVATDLTATIAAGEYTSTTTFLAAIKAAFEAAGASVYTVDLTSTGKIRIASDGAGGGGIFQIMWTDSDSAAMAAILGFDTVSDSTGALTYSADVLRIHTEEHFIWDLAFPTNPKAFLAVGSRNDPLKISPSALIKLQGNWTNNFDAPAVDLTIPYSDFAIGVWDVDGLADITNGYRYWKFKIEDKSNQRRYVELGAIYLGDLHDATRGAVVFPLERSGIDRSDLVFSEHGQIYGRKIPKAQGFNIGWQGLTKVEERSLWQHWEDVGLTETFFLILDLQDAFSVDELERVNLYKFEQAPSSRLISPNNFQIAWGVREDL